MWRDKLFLLTLFAVAAVGQTEAVSALHVRETRLGAVPTERVLGVTYDRHGWHMAAVVADKRHQRVWVDGRYVATEPLVALASLTFSPDGRRLAYGAATLRPRRDNVRRVRYVMVVGGERGAEHEVILFHSGLFSRDSQHFAYVAGGQGGWFLMVDNKVGARSEHRFLSAKPDGNEDEGRYAVFAPDGSRIACVTSDGKKESVVVDGKPGILHDRAWPDGVVFSPDSQHVAYMARDGSQALVVLDGKAQAKHESVSPSVPPVFTPDSQHIVYAARQGGKCFVVARGTPGPQYDGIMEQGILVGSSGHVAYAAKKGTQWFVVVDGQEGPAFEGIGADSITFSPDGERVAYSAMKERRWRVIVDGRPGPEWDGIAAIAFSPDSKRCAYSALLGGKWQVVTDGEGGPAEFRGIGDLRFSPDSRHLAYCGGAEGGRCRVVVDEQEVGEYEDVGQNGPSWREDGALEFLAMKKGDVYRVTVTLDNSG